MTSASTKATTKSILKPVTTLKGHGGDIQSSSYFPDGQRIISGSWDKTTRQWDLKAGKEVHAVAVSRDGRWVVTGGGDYNRGELKAREAETGIVKNIRGPYSILLASGSHDQTARIWNLETGKLVAGPFGGIGWVGAVRFSPDSKKLVVKLGLGTCIEVWDIQSQKLDAKIGKPKPRGITYSPVFWTNKNTICAAFEPSSDSEFNDLAKTIYEFDASTLGTVGAPFEGHTNSGLLSLLASYDVHDTIRLILSPDSFQLVYTNDYKICICDTPPDILAQARNVARKQPARKDLLHTTNICHTYSVETSTYNRPATTHFPSPPQTFSLLSSRQRSPCLSHSTSGSSGCPCYIVPTIISLRSGRNSI
ncbi:YVTN repeat-like/Quino protein amine dehydrogenase [Suillus decipiens]|nr:YVTN repeat-like/Quino protein amine dehydrogenase [Suillus decipiens]